MRHNTTDTHGQSEIRFLSVDEVSKWLAVPVDYVRGLASEGDIPSVMKHGQLLFLEHQLREWLHTRRFPAQPESDSRTK